MPEQPNSWNEYSQHVLRTLEALNRNMERLDEKVDDMRNRLTILETRAAMWGALAGLVVGGVVTFVMSIVLVK